MKALLGIYEFKSHIFVGRWKNNLGKGEKESQLRRLGMVKR